MSCQVLGQLGLNIVDDLKILVVGKLVLIAVELRENNVQGFALSLLDQSQVVSVAVLWVDLCRGGLLGQNRSYQK